MDDSFELLDPRNAQAFLQRFSSNARRKGGNCFHRGDVQGLSEQQKGVHFSAVVLDGGEHEVHLEYDSVDGWDGSCSCEREFDCEHVFAAMSALLAEHRTATVRRLSSGAVVSASALAAARGKADADEGGELPRRLMAATGRPLGKEETLFLRRVREVYNRCSQSRQITYWDFQQMGFAWAGNSWNTVSVWPAFPENEFEFWLYVANAILEQGFAIPEFMAPVTELELVRQKIALWHRSREIDKWKELLERANDHAYQLAAAPRGEVDLRVVVAEKEVRLEWQRPGQTAFEPLKQTHFRQLASEHDAGRGHFSPEAELIWHTFHQPYFFGASTHLRYDDSPAPEALGRLLRLRLLDSRIVNLQGQPLARPAEPLRWQLTPAAGQDDDYRLFLVQADGTPPPPILTVLQGHPTLYLSLNAVFTGPEERRFFLNPRQENRIPAPALERAPGVAFLQSLGVALPQRVAERVRTLPYQIAISCALKASFADARTEDCVFSVSAEAPDGHRLTWTGTNWLDETPPALRRKKKDDGTITLYDSAALAAVPPLLEPLPLKIVGYSSAGELAMRVTRRFPETFSVWLKSVPPHISVQLEGDLASLASPEVAGSIKLDVTEAEIDWFDLRVVLDVADTTLSAEEIKLLLNAKGGYVRLEGKGWRRLQYNLSEDEDERLARLGLSPRELSAEPQRLHALQLADEAAKKFLPGPAGGPNPAARRRT